MSSPKRHKPNIDAIPSSSHAVQYQMIYPSHGSQATNEEAASNVPNIMAYRLNYKFYDQECICFAKSLLGKLLVHCTEGRRVSGYIVETESYLGGMDKASHSYKGKRTNRNEPMFMPPGTAYVYFIYGTYSCFNISCRGDGAAVLIRALQANEGKDVMMQYREVDKKVTSKSHLAAKESHLCNGPSKMCQALSITKMHCNKQDMASGQSCIWLEDGFSVADSDIVSSRRIGVDSVGAEWANKLLRFYIREHPAVSVKAGQVKARYLPNYTFHPPNT